MCKQIGLVRGRGCIDGGRDDLKTMVKIKPLPIPFVYRFGSKSYSKECTRCVWNVNIARNGNAT